MLTNIFLSKGFIQNQFKSPANITNVENTLSSQQTEHLKEEREIG